jgi:hypothetical protein
MVEAPTRAFPRALFPRASFLPATIRSPPRFPLLSVFLYSGDSPPLSTTRLRYSPGPQAPRRGVGHFGSAWDSRRKNLPSRDTYRQTTWRLGTHLRPSSHPGTTPQLRRIEASVQSAANTVKNVNFCQLLPASFLSQVHCYPNLFKGLPHGLLVRFDPLSPIAIASKAPMILPR